MATVTIDALQPFSPAGVDVETNTSRVLGLHFKVQTDAPLTLTPGMTPVGLLQEVLGWRLQDSATTYISVPTPGVNKHFTIGPTGPVPKNAVLYFRVRATGGAPHNLTVALKSGTTTFASLPIIVNEVASVVAAGAMSIVIDRSLADPPLSIAREATRTLAGLVRSKDLVNVWNVSAEVLAASTSYPKPGGTTSTEINAVIDASTHLNGAITGFKLVFNPFDWTKKNALAPNTTLDIMGASTSCGPPRARSATILISGPDAYDGITPPPPVNMTLAATTTAKHIFWLDSKPAQLSLQSLPIFSETVLSTTDADPFLLTKQLLQAYSTTIGYEIILDPNGLLQDEEDQVPFNVAPTDHEVHVVVLTPDPEALELHLADATNQLLREGAPRKGAGFVDYRVDRSPKPPKNDDCSCDEHDSRRERPEQGDTGKPRGIAHGTWKAVLRRRKGHDKPVNYSVVVLAKSVLNFRAEVNQNDENIGSHAFLHVNIREEGLAVGGDRARVWAEVTLPDGARGEIELTDRFEGSFEAKFQLTQLGVTHFRIMTTGKLLSGEPFQRESSHTAFVRKEPKTPACCEDRSKAEAEASVEA